MPSVSPSKHNTLGLVTSKFGQVSKIPTPETRKTPAKGGFAYPHLRRPHLQLVLALAFVLMKSPRRLALRVAFEVELICLGCHRQNERSLAPKKIPAGSNCDAFQAAIWFITLACAAFLTLAVPNAMNGSDPCHPRDDVHNDIPQEDGSMGKRKLLFPIASWPAH